MTHWNVAVCDDERAALSILKGAIISAFQTHDVIATVELFERPRDLLRRMAECRFDLLFLDIEMPEINGLSLGRQLRKNNNPIDIIYISNREDLVFDALRVNPKGFIRKSKFLQDVSGVIDSYFASQPGETVSHLLIQDKDQISYINLSELMYIEGAGKNQLAHVRNQKEPVELHRQMQELEEELTGAGFIRVHKGFLVNYRFIRRIEDIEVVLTDGTEVPMSRRKAQETRSAYMELMQSGGSLVL